VAGYVKEVKMDKSTEVEEEPDERITFMEVVKSFFELTVNCEAIDVSTLVYSRQHFDSVFGPFLRGIQTLRVDDLDPWDVDDVAGYDNLKHLEVGAFGYPPGYDSLPRTPSFVLESFTLRNAGSPLPFLVQFITNSSSTLRRLGLPYDFAHRLDYSQFPELRTFELFDMTVMYGGPRIDARSLSRTWEALEKAPALTNLVLHGALELSGLSALTSTRSSLWRTPKTLPLFRTIEFASDFSIERLIALLSWPISNKLERLVVPRIRSVQGKTAILEKLESRALEAMGREFGFKVEFRRR
jgi:hypothetical protein